MTDIPPTSYAYNEPVNDQLEDDVPDHFHRGQDLDGGEPPMGTNTDPAYDPESPTTVNYVVMDPTCVQPVSVRFKSGFRVSRLTFTAANASIRRRIVDENPSRYRVRIWNETDSVTAYIAPAEADAVDGLFMYPLIDDETAGLELHTSGEVWASASGACVLRVVEEYAK